VKMSEMDKWEKMIASAGVQVERPVHSTCLPLTVETNSPRLPRGNRGYVQTGYAE
jgi:hypothetical protein